MRGIIHDSSGKMPHLISAAPPAQEERKPGTLPEQQSLVARSAICLSAVLHVTHRGYTIKTHNYCMGKLCCNTPHTPSEEWCGLRELRVTDKVGHLPRCKQDQRMVPGVPRVACAAPLHLAVSRLTALIRVLSEAPLLSMPRSRQRHQSHSKARCPAATPPPTSSCSLPDRK